jgi:hypothetical protein
VEIGKFGTQKTLNQKKEKEDLLALAIFSS